MLLPRTWPKHPKAIHSVSHQMTGEDLPVARRHDVNYTGLSRWVGKGRGEGGRAPYGAMLGVGEGGVQSSCRSWVPPHHGLTPEQILGALQIHTTWPGLLQNACKEGSCEQRPAGTSLHMAPDQKASASPVNLMRQSLLCLLNTMPPVICQVGN
jgi:hypothetical protein